MQISIETKKICIMLQQIQNSEWSFQKCLDFRWSLVDEYQNIKYIYDFCTLCLRLIFLNVNLFVCTKDKTRLFQFITKKIIHMHGFLFFTYILSGISSTSYCIYVCDPVFDAIMQFIKMQVVNAIKLCAYYAIFSYASFTFFYIYATLIPHSIIYDTSRWLVTTCKIHISLRPKACICRDSSIPYIYLNFFH